MVKQVRTPINGNDLVVDDLAERLRVLRAKCGKSQQEIADALQITITTYSSWERGVRVPRLKYLSELARMLEVQPDIFLKNRNATAFLNSEVREKSVEENLAELQEAVRKQSSDESTENQKIFIFKYMKLSDLMKIKGGKAELYTQLKMQPDVSLGMEPLKRERYFAVLYQFSDMVCADPAVSVPPNVLLICRTCSVELDFRKLRFALIRQQGVNEVKLRRIKLFDDNSFEVRTNDPAAEPQLIKRDQLQVFGLCMNFLKLFNN